MTAADSPKQIVQAATEVGHTEVRPAVAATLVVLCGLTLLSVPSVSLRGWLKDRGTVFGRLGGDEVGRDDGFFAANRALLRRIDELERRLEEGSVVLEVALPPLQLVLTSWGGLGNERVYVGRDGWLYLRQGIDYLTGPPFLSPGVQERRRRAAPSWEIPPEPDPVPAIVDFAEQLGARGIRLLVLVAPTKAMVRPEPLWDAGLLPRRSPAENVVPQNPSLAEWRRRLEEHAIVVFDPAETLRRVPRDTGKEAYLRADSHWSPEGVDAVARELASRIRLLGLPFEQPARRLRRRSYSLTAPGDLATALCLPSGQELFPEETVELRAVTGALVRGAEILVLGDSFANVFSDDSYLVWGKGAGLAEQLAFHLERPVDRIAFNDGGGTGSRRHLARDPSRLDGVRLVVLEFGVRELAVGDWPIVRLSSPLVPFSQPTPSRREKERG